MSFYLNLRRAAKRVLTQPGMNTTVRMFISIA